MTAQTLRLSDRQLKGVKPASKDYVLTDGDGLQLRVRSNGSLLWNFNYREPATKNRINMGLGTYPELSLANARKLAVQARELLAQGIDPKVRRDNLNEAKRAETEHTFENVATAWFELKKDSVTPAYAEDIWRSLTLHVLPDLKTAPLAKITAPMVIELLRPIEAKDSLETVKRLSQRLNEIMTYGVNSGLIFANPLSGIRAVFKKPKKENSQQRLAIFARDHPTAEIACRSPSREPPRRAFQRQLTYLTSDSLFGSYKALVWERGAAVSIVKLFSYSSRKYLPVPPTLFWLFFLSAFFSSKKQKLKKRSAFEIRTSSNNIE